MMLQNTSVMCSGILYDSQTLPKRSKSGYGCGVFRKCVV